MCSRCNCVFTPYPHQRLAGSGSARFRPLEGAAAAPASPGSDAVNQRTGRRGKDGHVTAARCRWWVFPIMAEGPAVRMDRLSHSDACFVSWGRGCVFLILFSFIFFYTSQPQPGFFSTRLHSCLSAKSWQTAAWICPPCQKRLETSWRSWIWSCLKVKGGEGTHEVVVVGGGGDARADMYVCF